MSDIKDIALRLIERNPAVAGNPNALHMVEVIRSGNAQEGERLARNLCQSYGVKPEDALKSAKGFFNL